MKIKSLISNILAVATLLSSMAFVACKSDDESSSGNNSTVNSTIDPTITPTIKPVEYPEDHYVKNTLHKVKVTESDNSTADYTILVEDNEQAKTAAAFIQSNVYQATGYTLPIVQDETVSLTADSKYIVIGRQDLFNASGLTMPEDDLGNAGYYIKSAGKTVFIACENVRGYQYGALAFLRETLGYDMIAYDTIIYEKSGQTVPVMDIIEAPDYEMSVNNVTFGSDAYFYGMGQIRQDDAWVIPEGGGFIHNSFRYLPPAEHTDKKSLWYSTGQYQLCYTARGDENELSQMVDIVAQKMKVALDENPTQTDISISIQDNLYSCTCTACKDEYQKYGTDSAALIKFVNKVAEKLDTWYEAEATQNNTEKRKFYVALLAYNKFFNAPVKEVNGKYEPIDESVRCNENVGVWIAPIGAQYNRSFYELENESVAKNIEAWASLTDRMYFWLYQTNFSSFLFPYNSFEAMTETLRFCKSYGAVYMYNQPQSSQGTSADAMTGFHIFKLYLNKCAMFDVNVDYKDCLDKFFKYYYLDASDAMREFYDELIVWVGQLEGNYAEFGGGSIYSRYDNDKAQSFWPKKKLDQWLSILDRAYDSIKKYKTENPDLYQRLYAHILKESIFPRYVLITVYEGKYKPSVLNQMRADFKKDCMSLGISCYEEGEYLTVKYEEWGV